MLVIIDGTGESSDAAYAKTMKNGFLKQLEAESTISPKVYFRGPTATGSECSAIVKKALNWISVNMQNLSRDTTPSLYLAGYSRGGTIAIAIAQEIQKLADHPDEQKNYDRGTYFIDPDHASQFNQELSNQYARSWFKLNRNIRYMALFDAVDRAIFMNTDVIPKNVQMVYHALRDPVAGSRRSFGNTGTSHAGGSAHYQQKYFKCTHAAMGGVPWTGDHPTELVGYGKVLDTVGKINPLAQFVTSDILRDEGLDIGTVKGFSRSLLTEEQDKVESKKVRDWMWSKMKLHGML